MAPSSMPRDWANGSNGFKLYIGAFDEDGGDDSLKICSFPSKPFIELSIECAISVG